MLVVVKNIFYQFYLTSFIYILPLVLSYLPFKSNVTALFYHLQQKWSALWGWRSNWCSKAYGMLTNGQWVMSNSVSMVTEGTYIWHKWILKFISPPSWFSKFETLNIAHQDGSQSWKNPSEVAGCTHRSPYRSPQATHTLDPLVCQELDKMGAVDLSWEDMNHTS